MPYRQKHPVAHHRTRSACSDLSGLPVHDAGTIDQGSTEKRNAPRYRRILIPAFSTCPSVAQLERCSELLAAREGSSAKVMLMIDRHRQTASDGPAGMFPPERQLDRTISSARKHCDALLSRSRLSSVERTVVVGDTQHLLVLALQAERPDLVIVTSGLWHARRVRQAARQAGVPVPEIMAVRPDGLIRRLRNALWPLGLAGMPRPTLQLVYSNKALTL